MIKVNFNLRDSRSKGKTSVIMVCYYSGVRLKLSTGIQIYSKEWNERQQVVRESQENLYAYNMNKLIKSHRKVAEKAFDEFYSNNEIPEPAQLKIRIKEKLKNGEQIDIKKDFWYYFDLFVAAKKKKNQDVRDYDNALRKHLLNTEKIINQKLGFSLIKESNGVFIDKWEDYLRNRAINASGEKGLKLNTIGKQNKNLKSFLNWAFKENITNQFNLSLFPTYQEERDSIYVTENELQKIRKLKIKDNLDNQVRDMFIVACRTGMRFSDFRNISTNSIDLNRNRIKYTSRKTKTRLEIPIHPEVKEIIKKYNNELPKYENRELTAFNKTLRKVAKDAGIEEYVGITDFHRGKEKIEKIKKYNLISSHTGRRTFCTLAYLRNIDTQLIMKISGHKTERSFMKYLKLDNELAANEFEKQWF